MQAIGRFAKVFQSFDSRKLDIRTAVFCHSGREEKFCENRGRNGAAMYLCEVMTLLECGRKSCAHRLMLLFIIAFGVCPLIILFRFGEMRHPGYGLDFSY